MTWMPPEEAYTVWLELVDADALSPYLISVAAFLTNTRLSPWKRIQFKYGSDWANIKYNREKENRK
jgi:hypothetical protein